MRVKLYTATGCSWCIKALHELTEAGFIVDVINLKNNSEALSHMSKNGFTTVPQVYIDGTHIGGYEATHKFLEDLHKKRIELYEEERIGTANDNNTHG